MKGDFIIIFISLTLFDSKLIVSSTSQIRITKSSIRTVHSGMVEYSGSIQERLTSSIIECAHSCSENDKCVSYFYNIISKHCVMHSKDFIFQSPSDTSSGWKYYVTRDGTNRCPSDFLYYRYLDFCYNMETTYSIDFTDIRSNCSAKGGRIAAVNSQQRQDYFSHFLAGRPIPRVCIDGNKQPGNNWLLDDGSPLTYFNWTPGDPDGGSNQLCLVIFTGDQWLDAECSYNYPCIFVCEA